MIINMANFFPMLSSSPPPIDDADNLGKDDDDDDDFGIFASTKSAYDRSLDSPIFEKGGKAKSSYHLCKTSNSDLPKELGVENCSLSINANNVSVEQKFNSHSSPSDADEVHNESGEECSKEFIADSVNEIVADDCHSRVSPSSICSSTDSPCSDPEKLTDGECDSHDSEDRKPSHVHLGDAEQLPCALSDSNSFETAKENDSESSEIKDLVANVSSIETTLPYPVSADVTSSATISSVNKGVETSVDASIETQNRFDEKDSFDLGDTDLHSDLPDCSASCDGDLSRKWNAALGENNKLDPASLSASDLPDLTFIPFPNEESGDDIDEFDGFQDYDYSPVIGNSSDYSGIGNEQPEDSAVFCETNAADDDFGNFKSVASANDHCPEPVIVKESDMNDFADFESSKFQAAEWETVDSTSKSDEFADFETATFEPDLKISVSSTKDSEKGLDKLSTVINTVFPLSEESEINKNNDKICEILDQNCKSRRLWERLHDTEQMPGLPFQWSVSHSFQQMLRSVNVDYHSILRTSTVPFFASGLGLLEPTKGITCVPENINSEEDNCNSKDPIPPVEFDWGSSGLVNPLDSGQAISTLMDLSFLNSCSNVHERNSERSFSLEDELLATSVVPDSNNSCKTAPILEQLLLSGAKSSITESYPDSRSSNLSQEAVRVLDQLPNISFMRAQVLMFPISNCN